MPDKYVFILHYAFHGEKPVTEEHPATKQGATRYKLSCGKDFVGQLAARSFFASKAAWYLSDDYSLDIGERIIFELKRIDEKYYLCAKGTYNLPDDTKIEIDGEEYTAKMLRKIAAVFIPRYSGAKSPEKKEAERVLWDNPTDWIKYDVDSEDYKQSLKVHNAVYMWRGHDSNSTKLVYVCIV